jgi:hypothetical protein
LVLFVGQPTLQRLHLLTATLLFVLAFQPAAFTNLLARGVVRCVLEFRINTGRTLFAICFVVFMLLGANRFLRSVGSQFFLKLLDFAWCGRSIYVQLRTNYFT